MRRELTPGDGVKGQLDELVCRRSLHQRPRALGSEHAVLAFVGEAQSVNGVLSVAHDVGRQAGRTVMRVGGDARQCGDDDGTGDVVTIPPSCVLPGDADQARNHGLQHTRSVRWRPAVSGFGVAGVLERLTTSERCGAACAARGGRRVGNVAIEAHQKTHQEAHQGAR